LTGVHDRAAPPPTRFEQWRRATLAPFEHRVFALFWWASLVSSLGGMIQTVGASWLMTTIAPSADMVALVQTASTLPFFFLSLVAGAYADTRDRRKMMIVSQVLALAASAALAAVVLLDAITPALLLGLTFLIGCGTAMFAPAWQASIRDLVPATLIPSAVMANAVGFNLARAVGPAIGGVTVAALGTAAAFVVNAFSYLGMLVTLFRWRPRRPRSDLPPEPMGTALAAGLRYVLLSPHIVAILTRCMLYTVPIAVVPALMPMVARDLLGGGAATYGLLLGGFGVGAMTGALSSAPLRERLSSDALLQRLSLVACVAVVCIGQSRWAALTMLATVFAGASWTLAFANFNIAIQLSSPRWVTARMLATYQTVVFASIAFGSWLWGEFASDAGLRAALTTAGLMALVSLVTARWLPVAVQQLGALDPRARPELLIPSVEVPPNSGPIVVVIEYRVPAANALEFVSVINEVGRIRRRDGARAWSISQDVDAVDVWVERFECPTWLDYLRWRTRPTQSDQAVRERLVRLIEGEHGAVRRLVVRPPGSRPFGAPPTDEPPERLSGAEPGSPGGW
jgi:MFS family permease